jgi:tetratricopeptide (TPR) repeat protein
VVLLIAVVAGTAALAQSRGRGRMSGKIVDEQGKGIEGVEIRILRSGDTQGLVVKTNAKGEWTHNNLAAGQWTIEFNKAGLEVVQNTVTLAEAQRLPAMSVTMKPAPPDPNVVINAELQRAVEFIKAGQVAEARKVYESLVEKYPTVYQLHTFVARAYAGENNLPKAIEHIKIALEQEPANTENQLLLAELFLMSGEKVEARKILDAVDLTKVTDPYPFLNSAIYLINEGKGIEAVATIDKLIKQFPNDNSMYYYRGRAYVAAQKFDEAKADFEKFVAAAPPDSKEAEDAKKILEQLVNVKK